MTPFELTRLPPLSRSTVDRREPLRDDADRQLAGWPTARVLPVDARGRAAFKVSGDRAELVYQQPTGDRPPQDAVLLGEEDGVAYWAVGAPEFDETVELADAMRDAEQSAAEPVQWLDLRFGGGLLDDTEAGLLVTAVAVLNWQRRSGFCARCGSPVRFRRAGWASWCVRCEHEEYPRTDPAVICLVHDGIGENGEQVIMARQPNWPPHFHSVLAGFVEAGESLEATVHREILEEVGVSVRRIRYLASQPWPFPRSLMLGFTAVADRSAPLAPADGEIAEARWVPRATIRAAFEANGEPVDGIALRATNSSIAGAMLRAWVDAG